jgi:putative phosphonate metabolism protein
MDEPRYAIYFVPPAGSDFYRFGARFLGYDCYNGEDLGHPPDIALAAPTWDELTREPRRYGFHATLKAPFRLRPPFTETDLAAELDRFAALPRASVAIAPTIRAIERFIAIVPRRASTAVDQLAADCVTAFDGFRRPLTPRERDRRVAAGASARQIENLDRWGYPFVFEDFRFHMTLTGAIDADRHGSIIRLLQAAFDRIDESRSLPIIQLVLARQDAPAARFRVVRQAKLTALRECR